MRHDQSIERIASPPDSYCLREPVRCRWIIQEPARIADQLLNAVSGAQPKSARLDEDLQFQETGGRRIQRDVFLQSLRPAIPLMKPDERIGIQQDHLAGRPPLNSRPAALHSHVHCPFAMSGSRDSIIFCRPARRGLSSGRITNRTPLRSITAGSPCSAASSKSENLARASATEYRFICPLYIRPGLFAGLVPALGIKPLD